MTYCMIDWTDEFNFCSCPERDLALAVINQFFDVEVTDPIRVGHYPLDTLVTCPEDKANKFVSLNKTLWTFVLQQIQRNGVIDLSTPRKIGKILHCKPTMFNYVLEEPTEFEAYAFEYLNGELQTEINFTVEFY